MACELLIKLIRFYYGRVGGRGPATSTAHRIKDLNGSRTNQWLAVMLFGVVYLAVGVAFPNPSAADKNQFLWRLAAWVICAGAFAIHIGLEHFCFQNLARRTAFH